MTQLSLLETARSLPKRFGSMLFWTPNRLAQSNSFDWFRIVWPRWCIPRFHPNSLVIDDTEVTFRKFSYNKTRCVLRLVGATLIVEVVDAFGMILESNSAKKCIAKSCFSCFDDIYLRYLFPRVWVNQRSKCLTRYFIRTPVTPNSTFKSITCCLGSRVDTILSTRINPGNDVTWCLIKVESILPRHSFHRW